MFKLKSGRSIPVALVSCVLGFGAIVGPASAQASDVPRVLNYVGGNSSNNNVLWLDFEGSRAVAINSDANTRASVRSFEFFKNTCDKRLDLLVADTLRGELVLYPGGADYPAAGIVAPCADGHCPARPDGLSASNERLLAVADTGGGGNVPRLWLYTAAECNGSAWPFQAPVKGGQLFVDGIAVAGIADTEFVKILGGGLNDDDLLVLTRGPTTISRIPRAQVLAGQLGQAEVLVGQEFFGSLEATGMAFVPATSGVADEGQSTSEILVVTIAGGRVIQLSLSPQGGSSQRTWPRPRS